MQPAITLSLRLSRQIWVTRKARGLRFHLFYRRSMGALVALVVGGEIITY